MLLTSTVALIAMCNTYFGAGVCSKHRIGIKVRVYKISRAHRRTYKMPRNKVVYLTREKALKLYSRHK